MPAVSGGSDAQVPNPASPADPTNKVIVTYQVQAPGVPPLETLQITLGSNLVVMDSFNPTTNTFKMTAQDSVPLLGIGDVKFALSGTDVYKRIGESRTNNTPIQQTTTAEAQKTIALLKGSWGLKVSGTLSDAFSIVSTNFSSILTPTQLISLNASAAEQLGLTNFSLSLSGAANGTVHGIDPTFNISRDFGLTANVQFKAKTPLLMKHLAFDGGLGYGAIATDRSITKVNFSATAGATWSLSGGTITFGVNGIIQNTDTLSGPHGPSSVWTPFQVNFTGTFSF